jgi:hypothetical protein
MLTILTDSLSPFTTGLTGFLGIPLMSGTTFVSYLSPFAASFPSLFWRKLMGGSFFMRSFSTFAGDFPLLLLVHGSKTTVAAPTALTSLIWHFSPSSSIPKWINDDSYKKLGLIDMQWQSTSCIYLTGS